MRLKQTRLHLTPVNSVKMISSAMNYYNTTLYEQQEEVVNIHANTVFRDSRRILDIYKHVFYMSDSLKTIIYRI